MLSNKFAFRDYYKCSVASCNAKKQVVFDGNNGEVLSVQSTEHNHPPPDGKKTKAHTQHSDTLRPGACPEDPNPNQFRFRLPQEDSTPESSEPV